MDRKIRTVVNFFVGSVSYRTVDLKVTIPNVALGQTFAFDHPQMGKCLSGVVTNIQHAVFLGKDDLPVTYIDVKVS